MFGRILIFQYFSSIIVYKMSSILRLIHKMCLVFFYIYSTYNCTLHFDWFYYWLDIDIIHNGDDDHYYKCHIFTMMICRLDGGLGRTWCVGVICWACVDKTYRLILWIIGVSINSKLFDLDLCEDLIFEWDFSATDTSRISPMLLGF